MLQPCVRAIARARARATAARGPARPLRPLSWAWGSGVATGAASLALTLALGAQPAAAAAGGKPSVAELLSEVSRKLDKLEGSAGGALGTKDAIEMAREVGRTQLFPMLEPYNSGYLSVPTTDGAVTHEIYYEECGNPRGKPVVIVHGGPGGGCQAVYRCFHDPSVYRIILFDQRGCGRSKPHAELRENTTWHLVADMERLRKKLGIPRWQVFGGSWGSTLGLSYSMTHPQVVTEIVLRGIFMLRRSELQFYYQDGASHIDPDRWEEYRDAIPVEERADFIQAYRKRLVGDDRAEQIRAARAWTRWENTTSNLTPPEGPVAGDEDKFALAFARIENHYFVHDGWFEWESWLLDNVDRIRHIPGFIVQGRYDVVCPAKSAWDLHRAWPEARFEIVQDSGHSAMEPGNRAALVDATERFKHLPF
jgi:proline iminopeptidase